MSARRFTSVAGVELPRDAQVLTYTQSEKLEMMKVTKKVSTIYELQGKQAKVIVLVKTSTKKHDVYASEQHNLVAISRHTEPFIYYTPDSLDFMSTWIRKAAEFTERDYQQVSNDITGGGGVVIPATYVLEEPTLPDRPVHENIVQSYYPWGFSELGTAHFRVD